MLDLQLGPALTSVIPSIVYGHGGYRVSIFGTSFDKTLNFCRVRSAVTPTDHVSSTLITCLTPKAPPGVALLEIGSVLIPGVVSAELLIQELPIPKLVSPSISPDYGGLVVTVKGLNFVDAKTLTCKFGEEASTGAKFISSTMIWCATPSHMPGTTILEVSNNGYDFSRGSVKFSFNVSVSIGSIFPSRGPTLGGTMVTLIGTHHDTDDHFFCSFGVQGSVNRCLPA